jgi:RES domain-containing protein
MEVYRLVPRRYLKQALTGIGAAIAPGRWNPPGLAVVYCATSRALAALEMLVHFDPGLSPTDLVLLSIQVADSVERTTLTTSDLPRDWMDSPAPHSTRALGGDLLARDKTAALLVPSVIVPEELVCVLNPRHPSTATLKYAAMRDFSFDARLVRR